MNGQLTFIISIICLAAATNALSVGERSYPTSEVRGRSWEDPMPKGWQPRGVTPRPRWGAAAENARLWWCRNGREELPKSEVRGSGREELPHLRSQGRRPGGATPRPRSGGCAGAGGSRGAIPRWRSRRAAVRRYPSSKGRSSGCALLEQPRRDTPRPR